MNTMTQNNTIQKEFALSAVLTFTTGWRLAEFRERSSFMEFITGWGSHASSPWVFSTLQETGRYEPLKQAIYQQHPQLQAVQYPDFLREISDQRKRTKAASAWLKRQENKFGKTVALSPIAMPPIADMAEAATQSEEPLRETVRTNAPQHHPQPE